MAITKKRVIIQNPELVAALRGFSPVFGNGRDLVIVKQLEKLNKKLGGVDNEVLRGLKNGGRALRSAKEKEILTMEANIIKEINLRKSDF